MVEAEPRPNWSKMAILWQKQTWDTRYEVRNAGRSLRLYSNGVFHSQYHPGREISGGVWDLLMLPAFFRPLSRTRRVLVLGVGGGTVIHLLNRFVAPEEIVGVELNPVHLQVARQFFGIERHMASLHQADAVAWLERYDGPPFDMIIDDLFGNHDVDLGRAVPADEGWCKTLLQNLNRNGILVMNFIGSRALRDCACLTAPALARQIKSTFQLSLPDYENCIGVFLGASATSRGLRESLAKVPALGPRHIDFRIRQIQGSQTHPK